MVPVQRQLRGLRQGPACFHTGTFYNVFTTSARVFVSSPFSYVLQHPFRPLSSSSPFYSRFPCCRAYVVLAAHVAHATGLNKAQTPLYFNMSTESGKLTATQANLLARHVMYNA
jgi:hypothetical protein